MSDPALAALQFFRDRFAIDPSVTSSLLSVALSRGGDFAELYFEHRTNSAITWEDQRVKSATRTVSQGLGIRVVRGDAIGYAYTESFEFEAMRRAAETAARISAGERTAPPIDATPSSPARRTTTSTIPLPPSRPPPRSPSSNAPTAPPGPSTPPSPASMPPSATS
ncbi:PmbA/TldA family metallopeptidase [Tepidiforma flava]|uniref:PmbA/TldA family metallopeptidase n=1 Tax=Tepidiforma flava TaxID=3004094 RepID=UPI0035715FAC